MDSAFLDRILIAAFFFYIIYINTRNTYIGPILKLLSCIVTSVVFYCFKGFYNILEHHLSFIHVQGFLIKNNLVYLMPSVLRASWLFTRDRARALKESSIKGKKKNRRARISLRRGNHVSHVDSRLDKAKVLWSHLLGKKGIRPFLYPSYVGSHGVILRPVLNAPHARQDDPGVARRGKTWYGYIYVCRCVYTCRLASGYFLLQVTRLSARIVDER